jgi:PAS domain S-box-containing protein
MSNIDDFQDCRAGSSFQHGTTHPMSVSASTGTAGELGRLSFFDHAPVAFLCMDSRGFILDGNRALGTLLGVPLPDLLGQALGRFLTADGAKAFNGALQGAGPSLRCEVQVQHVDGTTLCVQMDCAVVAAPTGTLIQAVLAVLSSNGLPTGEARAGAPAGDLGWAQSLAHVGSWTWDVSGNGVEWSDEMYRIFGLDKTRITGRLEDAIARAIHPEDLHRVRPSNARAFTGGPVEYRVIRPDGSIRHVLALAGAAVLDAAGKPFLLRGTCQDITDRKHIEMQLSSTRDLLERTEELARVGGWELDLRTMKQVWSRATCRILELDVDETPVFEGPDGFYAPEARPVVLAALQAAMEHGTPFDLELRVVTARGRAIWVRSQASAVMEGGRVVKLHGTLQDVTDRKHAELALQENERKLAGILDNVAACIYLKDTRGRYLFANKPVLDLFGCRLEEVVGKTDELFFSPDSLPQIQANDRQVLVEGRTIRSEETGLSTRDGKAATYLVVKLPLRDEDGCVNALCGISTDITAHKATEEEKAAQASKVHKAESLERMASAIAHHFNNHLHAVMMSMELCVQDLASMPTHAAVLDGLAAGLQSARKAAEVSSLMLTYLGHSRGTAHVLDLVEECGRGIRLLRAGMPKRLALTTEFPSRGPCVKMSGTQFNQVLTNLVTNALEACTAEDARVRVAVREVPASQVPPVHRFPADWRPSAEGYACLEVEDTGTGITENDMGALFDPFFSSKFTGRGLGLPVVLGIARSHGGGVTVKSTPGQGSIFRFFLPVTHQEVTQQPPPPQAATPPRGKVLVVDDEEVVRKVLMRALTRHGFEVVAAEDGVAALEEFGRRRHEIVCVLCDLSMPRLGGWETLAELRKVAPEVPVILASGYSEAQVMDGHHTERPDAFLSKPYQVDVLLNTVSTVLVQAAARGGGRSQQPV